MEDSPTCSTAPGGETISGADKRSRDRLLYELEASRKNRPHSPAYWLSTLSITGAGPLFIISGRCQRRRDDSYAVALEYSPRSQILCTHRSGLGSSISSDQETASEVLPYLYNEAT